MAVVVFVTSAVVWGAISQFHGSQASSGPTALRSAPAVCAAHGGKGVRRLDTSPAALLKEIKRRGGIRGLTHPTRRLVAPATQQRPTQPASTEAPAAAVADPGCGAGVRCCSASGTRAAPG